MRKYRKEAIPLVVAFTPNYFVPAATCLYSILEHSDTTASFHVICLLTEELPDNMKEALAQLDAQRLQVIYLNLEGQLGDIYVDERYTIAASYRLLLPEILPQYDKVLYIDCDVVVRNDLAKLYRETALEAHYLAAVFEASLDFQIPYLESIGCRPGEYINSGFLLMNLAKLRADNMVPKFLEAARTEGLQFPDQDVLNQLCKGRILGLPPYYNGIRTFFLPQYKADFLRYYSDADWQAVQQHGTMHYTGAKPWNAFTVAFQIWWQYYEQLPEAIKGTWKPNKRMYRLYKMSNTGIGRYCLDGLQQLVRRFKYGVA